MNHLEDTRTRYAGRVLLAVTDAILFSRLCRVDKIAANFRRILFVSAENCRNLFDATHRNPVHVALIRRLIDMCVQPGAGGLPLSFVLCIVHQGEGQKAFQMTSSTVVTSALQIFEFLSYVSYFIRYGQLWRSVCLYGK